MTCTMIAHHCAPETKKFAKAAIIPVLASAPYLRYACLLLKLSIKFASFATASIGMALYNEARHPPTDRWPARFVKPRVFASARNCFVKSASSPLMTKGTFIRDLQSLFTGHEKNPLLLSM